MQVVPKHILDDEYVDVFPLDWMSQIQDWIPGAEFEQVSQFETIMMMLKREVSYGGNRSIQMWFELNEKKRRNKIEQFPLSHWSDPFK